jgi:hypothetical protein
MPLRFCRVHVLHRLWRGNPTVGRPSGRMDPLVSGSLEFLHLRTHGGMIGFVSGHGFSRAAPFRKGIGL